ncbi:hypothetical protein ACWD0J_34470 [Streptomyces sp. NPDC003011]
MASSVPAGDGTGELAPGADRAMLEWERRCPQDGHVVGMLLRLRGHRPTRERLAAWAEARSTLVPALAEHLAGPARRERWTSFEGFDAARHIHVVEDLGAVSAAECAVNLSVPAERPRWGLWLLPAAPGDVMEYTLAYRVHHAAQDGVAMVHTLERLFDAATPTTAFALPGLRVPLGRGGTPGTVPAGERVADVADVPVAALKVIARWADCSDHDVYLAALAGALRAWPAAGGHGKPVAVRMPFSLRLPFERRDRGNKVGHARVLLPVDEPSARRRLALVAERTEPWKGRSARDRTRRVQERMSDRMYLEEFSAFLDADDSLATATSTRFRRPMAFDGDPVTHVTGLPPLYAGHLFTSLLSTHGTRATVCFTARAQDRHVLDLARLWEDAVGELATAHR